MADNTSMFPMHCQNIPRKPEDGWFKPYPSAYLTISDKYHYAMEQGRFLEQSIGDVQKEVQIFKKNLEDRVKTWIRMQLNQITVQLPLPARVVKAVLDVIDCIKGIIDIIKEIQNTIKALITIIQLLKALLQKMLGQIQAVLNAIANLINEICNWNLPKLPSIPNLFGDLIWGFNGFQLRTLKLNLSLKFDKNFAFGHCSINPPNANIFSNFPRQIAGSNGVSYGNQLYNPPLGGLADKVHLAPFDITAEYKITTLDPETSSYLILDYNTTSQDMNRAFPNPLQVLNNYFMTPDIYKNNLVCLFPFMTPAIAHNKASLVPIYTSNITLESIIASDFDPNIVAAWIIFASNSLLGWRGAYWIPEFRALFNEAILPSKEYLDSTEQLNIPYNFFEPSTSTISAFGLTAGDLVTLENGAWVKTASFPTGMVTDVINPTTHGNDVYIAKNAPQAIPFIAYVKNHSDQSNLLWRLSWIEAGLLGYHRSNKWDESADSSFLSAITQTDLDYKTISIAEEVTPVVLSQGGKAYYPPTISVPISILGNVQLAIEKGMTDIENNATWRTSSQYRYIYDQYAQQHEIDRYSQFWRVWAMNFSNLLKAGKVLPYAAAYWQMIDSACNPLGDNYSNYLYLKYDAENRNSTWVPGDIRALPDPPDDISSSQPDDPTELNNGWTGDTLNDAQFLLRPDIKVQPIPVQMAMLDLNKCYSILQTRYNDVTNAMNSQIDSATKSLTAMPVSVAFSADATIPQSLPPATLVPFVYSEVTMDVGVGNFDPVTGDALPAWVVGTEIKVPILPPPSTSESFMVMAYFPFAAAPNPTVRTVEFLVNGISEITISSANLKDAAEVAITQYLTLNVGDVVSFILSHNDPINTLTLDAGSSIAIMSVSSSNSSSSAKDTSLASYYPSGVASLPELTAVYLDANGYLQITDPTDPTLLTSGKPWLSGVTLVTTSNLHDTSSVAATNGVTFTAPSASFTPGELLYVQAGGVISNTFPPTYWKIAIGQSVTPTSFIYQPQLPLH